MNTHGIYNKTEFNSMTGEYKIVGTNLWLNGKGKNELSCKAIGDNISKRIRVCDGIYETFIGPIPLNYKIEHIDSNINNNKLSNLKCVEIIKRKAIPSGEKRIIKSIMIETGETKLFSSKTQCARYYGCNPAMVYLCCENKCDNYANKLRFEYATEDEELQEDVITVTKVGRPNTLTANCANPKSIYMKRYHAKKKAELDAKIKAALN